MSLKEWLFETGEITNPYFAGQWKFLHIATLVICVGLIFLFKFIVNKSMNKEKTKKVILITLVSLILLFGIASRVVFCFQKYYFNLPSMESYSLVWIILPKPWCAISCWVLIASVIVNKKFFYNYSSISALLCSIIFFIYPGVGFNNKYIMFSNLYSIVTHALLLTTSIALISFKFTDFRYKDIWKVLICFAVTYVYALLQIFVLKIRRDPMYFMPHGDIQEGILNMSWPLYLILYIVFILIYINIFYLIQDKQTVSNLFKNKAK